MSRLEIRDASDFARAFGVSRETAMRLDAFVGLLKTWQATINLVSAGSLGEIWQRHLADSAQVLAIARDAGSLKPAFHWVDVGSGGGFPGLVVAALLAGTPGMAGTVTLVESDNRKAAFLREGARALGLAGSGMPLVVDIRNGRIETAANQSSLMPVDVVSARALAPLPRLFDLTGPLWGANTIGLFPKGREAAAEIEAARSAGRWDFEVDRAGSLTDPDATVLIIRRLRAAVR